MSSASDKTGNNAASANAGKALPKIPARFVTIGADMAERRLDNFLMGELGGLPRSHIYKMIRSGEVRVNKGRIKPAHRLLEGDIVRIPPVQLAPERAAAAPENPEWINKYIIYRDDDVIAINKPSGLAVHGGSGISSGLIELLRAANPQEHSLELVHRLDRSTSGCLLVARRRSSLRYLHEAFREGDVKKSYLALLEGRLASGTQDVKLPLEVHTRKGGERHVTVSETGKPAHTRFIPLSVHSEATYCKVDLFTGRTHQIRVHAQAIGHPVLGDERYGTEDSNAQRKLKLKRLFLHAAVLEYPERNGHGTVMIQAPLGEELTATLNRLEKMR
jgi:23S rRNA pseudouridine955/2504/2580 synthase